MTTYREGNMQIYTAYDIIHDEMSITVTVPRTDLENMDRRMFANMMYDFMQIPLAENAERAAKMEKHKNERRMRDREIGIVPIGMSVVWCPDCFMSVTWTKEDMFSYGDDWHPFPGDDVLAHDHG